MPLINTSIETYINGDKITDYTTPAEVLAIVGQQFTNVTGISIKPQLVHTLYFNNQTLPLVTGNTYVLAGQTTVAENGLYDAAGNPQALPNTSTLFFGTNTVGSGAGNPRVLYSDVLQTWSVDYNENYRIGFTQTTSSTNNIDFLDFIPVLLNRATKLNISVMGYHTTGSYYAEYEKGVYNDNGTFRDVTGNLATRSKLVGTFARPKFDLPVTTNTFKFTLQPGDTTSTTWFIRGSLEL